MTNINTITINLATFKPTVAPRPWWRVVSIRCWLGFGMRNLTVRLCGRVILKLAVAA
jgi:hypothetical protein